MKQHILAIACICSAVALVTAAPLSANNQELDVLQIPLSNGKELDVLTLGAKEQEQLIADRNKRTIGLLRELFPDITKQIDEIVNRIIAQVIRVAGPSLLPALLGNNRPTTERTSFDADFDDDDDDGDDSATSGNDLNTNSVSASSGRSGSGGGARVSIDLPTFAPDDDDDASTTTAATNKNGATDTQIDLSAINKQLEETIRVARQVKEAEAAAQAVAAEQPQQPQQPAAATAAAAAPPSNAPQQLPIPNSNSNSNEAVQLSFNNEVSPLNNNPDNSKAVNNNLQPTEPKSPAIDELTLDSNEDTADLDDRNKRFLSFGGGGLAGGSSGGNTGNAGGAAAGGSGNFLFDIVRLFSGSVQTQAGDEAANSANSVSDSDGDSDANRAADGYTEAIPGPVTRLVVLANRGLANLIQDLILRIAATSEKFVNFKAKLITALI